MKLEQKRVRNNEFEQVEKCCKCGKLFWAKSTYELGCWQDACLLCEKKETQEFEVKKKLFVEQGRELKGSDNQVYGWEFNGEHIYARGRF